MAATCDESDGSTSTAAQGPVWRAAGMPALLVLTATGFAGFAALLPVAPLWAVSGGADPAGSGFVNGMLMLTTVLTQPFVPWLLRRFGTGRVLTAGLVLLGGPALLHLVSSGIVWVLVLSAVRGLGFGILTVTGSLVVANLVPPARHGAAIGTYGAAVAVPQLVLLPAGPWLVDAVGFWSVFLLGTLPLLGIGAAARLARTLGEHEVERSRAALDRPGPADGSQVVAPGRRQVWAVLARPMLLLLAATLAGGALVTFAPQMSTVPAATTGGLALLTATAAASRWGLGALADRHGTERFVWPLVVLSAGGLALAAYAVKDPAATAVLPLLAAMALVGVAYGGLQNLTLVLSLAAVRREDYGTASATWNVGFDLGTGVGAVLVGVLASGSSFTTALLVAAAISLATLPLALARGRAPAGR